MGKGILTSSTAVSSGVAPTAPGVILTASIHAIEYTDPDQSGRRYVRIIVNYTAPGPLGTFKGVHAYVEAPDGTDRRALGGLTLGTDVLGTTFTPIDAGKFPYDAVNLTPIVITGLTPPQQSERWRVYLVSYSDQIENALVPADQVGATVSVFDQVDPAPSYVVGAEYAPNAIGFSVDSVEYRIGDGGVAQWRFNASWSNNSSDLRYPQLGGDDITIAGEDGTAALVASPSKNDNAFTGDWWNVPSSPTVYTLRMIAWDTFGHRNTILPGVTPQATLVVQRQAGGVGEEYTTLVALPTVSIEYQLNGDGGEEYRIVMQWVRPTDPTFGGVTPTLRWATDPTHNVPIGNVSTPVSSFRTAWYSIVPGGSNTFDMYFVSYDMSVRSNTLDLSVTPKVLGVSVSYQTTGSLKGSRLDPSTLEASLAINTALLGIAPGGVTNTKVANGAIDTPKLTTNEISIGGAGGKPIRFRIYNSGGSAIAWIGDDSAVSGFVGAWFKQIYIGGSGPSGAPFNVDSSGQLQIQLASGNVGAVPFSLTLNGAVASITNGTDASTGFPAGFKILQSSNGIYSIATPQGFFAVGITGSSVQAQLQAIGTAPTRGIMKVSDSSDSSRAVTCTTSGAGSPFVEVALTLGAARLTCVGGTPALLMNTVQVVTTQQTGPGNTTDVTDVATRFNNLLTALRAHGLIT